MTNYMIRTVVTTTVNIPDEQNFRAHDAGYYVTQAIEDKLRGFSVQNTFGSVPAEVVHCSTMQDGAQVVPGNIRRRMSLFNSITRSFSQFFDGWNTDIRKMYVGRYSGKEQIELVTKYRYLAVTANAVNGGSTITFPAIPENDAPAIWEDIREKYQTKCEDIYMDLVRTTVMEYLEGIYEDGGISELREQNVTDAINQGIAAWEDGERRDQQELF